MTKSMIDTAYDIVSKSDGPVEFGELLRQVGQELGIEDEEVLTKKAGGFYTDLTLDGRLVICANNHWDLKKRHRSAEYRLDMSEIYSADESDHDDNEENPSELGDENDEDKKSGETSEDDDEDEADQQQRSLNFENFSKSED